MFTNLRQAQLAMADQEIRQLVEQGEYAVISVLGPNGYPYGFPMSYVVLDGHIYFHGAQVGHKVECLKYSNKVSFTVVGTTEVMAEKLDTNYESVVAFGCATEVTGREKDNALMALVSKYSPGFEEKGLEGLERESDVTAVFRIEVEHMTGKRRRSNQS